MEEDEEEEETGYGFIVVVRNGYYYCEGVVMRGVEEEGIGICYFGHGEDALIMVVVAGRRKPMKFGW